MGQWYYKTKDLIGTKLPEIESNAETLEKLGESLEKVGKQLIEDEKKKYMKQMFNTFLFSETLKGDRT